MDREMERCLKESRPAMKFTHWRWEVLSYLSGKTRPASAREIAHGVVPFCSSPRDWSHTKLRWLYERKLIVPLAKRGNERTWVITQAGREALAATPKGRPCPNH